MRALIKNADPRIRTVWEKIRQWRYVTPFKVFQRGFQEGYALALAEQKERIDGTLSSMQGRGAKSRDAWASDALCLPPVRVALQQRS